MKKITILVILTIAAIVSFNVIKNDVKITIEANANSNVSNLISDPEVANIDPFAEYSAAEMELINAQPALKNAIRGSYAYSPEKTEEIHNLMDTVFGTATGTNTYTDPSASTVIAGANTEFSGTISQSNIPAAEFDKLPSNVRRVIRLMPEEEFEYLFPVRHESYKYTDLLKAIAKWPYFCSEMANDHEYVTSGTTQEKLDKICGAELASMFAHFAQEVGAHSGSSQMKASLDGYVSRGAITLANPEAYFPQEEWRQALFHVEEAGYAGTDNVGYRLCVYGTFQATAFPCGDEDSSYHGRGAKQLSYNYNYAPFSRLMYGDFRLLQTPEKVADDGFLALASAVYFYMMPRSPKPSIHETVVGLWTPSANDIAAGREFGFGIQTLIINGGIECGGTVEVAQSANRLSYFEGFSRHFGAWDGWYANGKQGCKGTQVFSQDMTSAYYYKGYYTGDWNDPSKCQLVGWEETGFSAFFPGDFERCGTSKDTLSFPDERDANGNFIMSYYQDAFFIFNPNATASVERHDTAKEYFVNVLVQGEDSNVYRARREVPANTPLSDINYWQDINKQATSVKPDTGDNTGGNGNTGGGNVVLPPSNDRLGVADVNDVTKDETFTTSGFYQQTYTSENGNIYYAKWWVNVAPSTGDNAWKHVGTIDSEGKITLFEDNAVVIPPTPEPEPTPDPDVTPEPEPEPEVEEYTGTWDKDKIYYEGDKVTYNDVEYIAGWWTKGDVPTKVGRYGVWKRTDGQANTGNDTTDGNGEVTTPPTDNDVITDENDIPNWDENIVYTEGMLVTFNGKVYRAHWYVQGGENPEDNDASSPWSVWRLSEKHNG